MSTKKIFTKCVPGAKYITGDNKYCTGPMGPQGPLSNTEYHKVSSENESTTTSTIMQPKLTLIASSLPDGIYRLGYGYEVSNINNTYLTEIEIKLDETVVGLSTYESDQDYRCHSGFVYKNLSGFVTATIKHRVQTCGTSKIRKACLELWRIS